MLRRLAAILASDVVGYSSLMNADEVGTLMRLKTPDRGFRPRGGNAADYRNLSDEQFQQASDFLRAVHPNVRFYWSDADQMD